MEKPNKFYNIERDGITQGLLAKWLECRQKARWFLQGFSPKGSSMGLTYGSVVHGVLELAYRDIQLKKATGLPSGKAVLAYTRQIEKQWHKENPQADVKSLQHLELSLLIAEATIPIYFEYWNKDFKELQWRSLEEEFKIPLELSDGRKTFIRGKRDGVFGPDKRVRLFETKTKSRMSEDVLVEYLPFELQVMLYSWSLWKELKKLPSGFLYNIIRRVQLEQKKSETVVAFSKRCIEDIRKRPQFYFVRMKVDLEPNDIYRFEAELQDMVKDFYDWWQGKAGHYKNTGACEAKYGRCEMLEACTGNMRNYTKRPVVFRELEDL